MQVDEDIAINESLEAVAFDDRERLADVVDACDSQSTERDRSVRTGSPGRRRLPISLRPRRNATAAAQAIERGRYIIVKR